MNVFLSLVAVLAVMLSAYVGTGVLDAKFLFGTILPYAAIATFLIGFIYRIVGWAKSPVPFRIPTTCGQQKSLQWLPPARHRKPPPPAAPRARRAPLFGAVAQGVDGVSRVGAPPVMASNLFRLAALTFLFARRF